MCYSMGIVEVRSMPKVKISTYTSFDILADGTIVRLPVTKIVSEDGEVKNISKEVSVFDKFATKKEGLSNEVIKPAYKKRARLNEAEYCK